MTRIVSSLNATATAGLTVGLVVLADLDFLSGHIRVHDGVGPLAFGGNTYSGVGTFGGIEGGVVESVDFVARPLTLKLSGVDASLVTTTMTEVYQNRTASLYVGLLDLNSALLVDTPELCWEGRMDTMRLEINQGVAVITLACEHRLYREPRIARYTDQDEQLAYSGDVFFNQLSNIPMSTSNWGAEAVSFGGGGGRNREFNPVLP